MHYCATAPQNQNIVIDRNIPPNMAIGRICCYNREINAVYRR